MHVAGLPSLVALREREREIGVAAHSYTGQAVERHGGRVERHGGRVERHGGRVERHRGRVERHGGREDQCGAGMKAEVIDGHKEAGMQP